MFGSAHHGSYPWRVSVPRGLFLSSQVQTCLDALRRIAGMKAQGVVVEAQSVAGSIMMPRGKLEDVAKKRDAEKSKAPHPLQQKGASFSAVKDDATYVGAAS